MSEDPERGCGTKAPSACYGESPPAGTGGILDPWTWLLSDGYSDFIPISLPPRKMITLNPAATIVTRGLERVPEPVFDIVTQERYMRMLAKTRNIGVGDHVGSDNYSCHSFAVETRGFGSSRRMTRQTAKELAALIWNHGAIPFLYSHNRVPVFDDKQHTKEAFRIVNACSPTVDLDTLSMGWIPTWEEEDWTQYTSGKTKEQKQMGTRHFMKHVLYVVSNLDMHWRENSKSDFYKDARSFFADVRFVEQAFGMSWLGHITLTASEAGQWDEEAMEMEFEFGDGIINRIDLNQLVEDKK
jgi:hypothetical protein